MLEKTIPYIWMAVARDCASELLASLRVAPVKRPWMKRWERDLSAVLQGVVELTPIDSLRFIIVDAPAYAREINVSLASGDASALHRTIKAPRWIRNMWRFLRAFILNPTLGLRRLAVDHRSSRRRAFEDLYEWLRWSRSFAVTCVRALRQVLGLYARLTYKTSDGPWSSVRYPSDARPSCFNTASVKRDGNRVTVCRCRKQRASQLWVSRGRRVPLLYAELKLPYAGKTDDETLLAFERRVTECPTLPSGWHWLTVSLPFWQGFSISASRWESDLEPKHGPGAVAEGWAAPEKEMALALRDPQYGPLAETLTRPLFALLGYELPRAGWETSYPRTCTDVDRSTWLAARVPRQNAAQWPARSSRVCLVPKDYRGKRVIAAEPCLHQYVQQGVMKQLVNHIRHSFLQGVIHLNSQDFNRAAAREGSRYGELDTIDLSDASDTVRVDHLKLMLEGHPDLLDTFMWLRTRSVSVQDSVVELTTAFPMGSALCFPMESICFSMCLLAEAYKLPEFRRFPATGHSARLIAEKLHLLVYGDDIIIHHAYSAWAIRCLERWGFKPNRSKCCTSRTTFRESCGADCLFGDDVTPLRPRALPGSTETTLESMIANVEEFARKGLLHGSVALLDVAQRAYDCEIPIVPSSVRVAGCISSDLLYYYADKTAQWKRCRDVQTTATEAWIGKPRFTGKGTMRHLRESLLGHANDPLDPPPVFQGWPDGNRLTYTKCRVLLPGDVIAVVWTDQRIGEFLAYGIDICHA